MVSNEIDLSQITRPELFVRRNPTLGKTISSVRWDIFNAEHNGHAEAGALLKMGRSVYIVEPLYLAWMLSHRISPSQSRGVRHVGR